MTRTTTVHAERGELLMREGGDDQEVYVIVKGTVRPWFSPAGDAIARLGPGDICGELAALDHGPVRPASSPRTTSSPSAARPRAHRDTPVGPEHQRRAAQADVGPAPERRGPRIRGATAAIGSHPNTDLRATEPVTGPAARKLEKPCLRRRCGLCQIKRRSRRREEGR